jgi:hypothetical protein
MKIFKRKKSSSQHELLQQIGVGSYFEIPDDFDADAWIRQDTYPFRPIGLRKKLSINAKSKLNELWFKMLVKNFARSVYEIGSGDFSGFVEDQRYKPRADYLIKNKFLQVQFGIYIIEYTIANGVAYSHFSLNYGLSYLIYMESHLVKNYETNQMLLVDLFRETEEHLFGTFTSRTAPYSPNYHFR